MCEAQTTNRAFYDRIASYYDPMADSSEHKAREAGEAALGLRSGERVLEIGFGTGNGLVEMARAVGSSGKVTGLDISEGMLAVAREKVEREGLSSTVELDLGDARDLPFDDGSFDAAFLSFTLELFEEEDTQGARSDPPRAPSGRTPRGRVDGRGRRPREPPRARIRMDAPPLPPHRRLPPHRAPPLARIRGASRCRTTRGSRSGRCPSPSWWPSNLPLASDKRRDPSCSIFDQVNFSGSIVPPANMNDDMMSLKP